MTLADWDNSVRPHLHYIEAGAAMAARHARELQIRPNFESRAEHELAELRSVLSSALAFVISAQEHIKSKPVEGA